jgi:hypothetical protein
LCSGEEQGVGSHSQRIVVEKSTKISVIDLISSEDCIKWCSADVKAEVHQALVLLPSCFPERMGVKQK